MNTDRPIFKPGVDAQTLAKFLLKLPEGSIATYEVLSGLIGINVQEERGALDTARKVLLRENGMVFGAVHGVGLKRLSDSEVVEQGSEAVVRIRRATRRSMTRLSTADFDALPKTEQNTHRMVSATLGAIALCSGTKARHKLEQRIQSNSALDVGEAMKLFETAAK